ncbi:glycosyltransferase family 2 protein, partial [Propionicimonas sp.]|uniref:glycosyltransferase family 2 protein n=1 Tax=Propionicimonas sp. TaxID=1955623 RepID=UPI0039E57A8C
LPPAEPAAPAEPPAMSVVVCTRERPDALREALDSLVALDHPDYEVIVVDNAPLSDRTAAVADDYRVRYVVAPVAGLSRARNVGMSVARHPIVAFTDDDVVADPQWLRGLAAGFGRGGDVACVSGLVPSGELRNAVQTYFDARVSWSKNLAGRVFRLSDPPADLPMFPFCVGEYGTGANFAVRRDAVRAVGGFDEALGVGTRTRGGEDLDIFTRLLFAGHALVVEPSAVIWHRHRDDLPALRTQAVGYGRGLGAWLTTLALQPRALGMALGRSPRALARLVHKPMVSVEDAAQPFRVRDDAVRGEVAAISRLELWQVLTGPAAYLAERWSVRGAAA